MIRLALLLLLIGLKAYAISLTGSLNLASTFTSATYTINAYENDDDGLTLRIRFSNVLNTQLAGG